MRRGLALLALALLPVAVLHWSHAASAGVSDPFGHRSIVLGRSAEGRVVRAVEEGDFDSGRKTLVVGCIHGNECAGIAVAARLMHVSPPSESDLWIVPDLNPDGAAAGTRGNADGVDLNRNFPWHWARLGGVYYSGPRPLSEPETRIAYRLITRVRPSISIWFHQHLDVVDDSSGKRSIERRFAVEAGLRLASLAQEPGSAVTWQSHCFPDSTPFVVELPAGTLSTAETARLTRAVGFAAASAPANPAPAPCGA